LTPVRTVETVGHCRAHVGLSCQAVEPGLKRADGRRVTHILGSHTERTPDVCATRWMKLHRPLAERSCCRKQPQRPVLVHRSTGSRWAREAPLRRCGQRAWTLCDTMSPRRHVRCLVPTAAVQRQRCQCAARTSVTESCSMWCMCDAPVGAGCRRAHE
jgi:hypothetical protein